jgi:hypothetical protein
MNDELKQLARTGGFRPVISFIQAFADRIKPQRNIENPEYEHGYFWGQQDALDELVNQLNNIAINE